jgi:hypothetical protein
MSDRATRIEIRDMLRHLGDGDRLSGNQFVVRCLGVPFPVSSLEPRRLSFVVRQLIEAGCVALPPLKRAIIVRCDLGGEVHRQVASALGMSIRTFYRERAKALDALSDVLTQNRVRADLETPSEPDPLSLHECYVDALQQAGHFSEAIAVLDSLLILTKGTHAFVRMACRFVDLCCEAGLTSEAEGHFTSARNSLAALAASDEAHALECELEFASSQLAWRRGFLDAAESRARSAVLMARRLERLWWHRRYDECVGAALLMQSETRQVRGDFSGALTLATEASDLFSNASLVRPSLRLRSLNAVAISRAYLPGPVSRSLEEFGRAYEFASMHSLPRDAARIFGMICALHIRRGDLERAISSGAAAAVAARAACTDFEQATISLDLATAHTLRGDTRSARVVLMRADKQIRCNALTHGISRLVAADTFICEGRFDTALTLVQEGQRLLADIPGGRFVGSALRVQADALEGLGDLAAARTRIKESLEVLSTSGHPFTLFRSYSSSARINRSRSHLIEAQSLKSELLQ